MYQVNCRILDGKNVRIDDCGSPYTCILSNEHSTEIVNADHANKMDAMTDDGHAQAPTQKHISVTTVTITPRRASQSPTGLPSTSPVGLGAPLLQLDRPGDSELDVVQSPRSTIVIPRLGKATPPRQGPTPKNPVCGQTDRGLVDDERNSRPVFTEKLKSVSVEEGQGTRFSCQIKGQPVPSVHWEKDGRQVAGEKFKLTGSLDAFFLEIQETGLDDAGRYVCVAKNQVGETRSMASLMVQRSQGHGPKVGQIDFKSSLQNRTQLKTSNLQSMEQFQKPDYRSALKNHPSDVTAKPTFTCRQPSQSATVTHLSGASSPELNPVEDGRAGTNSCQEDSKLGSSSATSRLTDQGASIGAANPKENSDQDFKPVGNPNPNPNDLQNDYKYSPTKATESHPLSPKANEGETNLSPRVTKRSNESEERHSLSSHSHQEKDYHSPRVVKTSNEEEKPCFSSHDNEGKTNHSPEVTKRSNKEERPSLSSHNNEGETNRSPRVTKRSNESEERPILSSHDHQKEDYHSPKVSKRSDEEEKPSLSPHVNEESSQIPMIVKTPTEVKVEERTSRADVENSSSSDVNPAELLKFPNNSSLQTENPSTNSQPEFLATGKTDSSTAQVGSIAIDDEDDDAFEPVSNDVLSSSVEEPPFIEDLQPENVHVCCGSDILLVARFSGFPLPQTKWLKGTELLAQDDRIRFETKPRLAELMILNAQPEDTGIYTLVITNEFGEDKQLSSVTVEDKPDPPVGRPAVTSILDNSVVLSWSGSSYDGGCSVGRYRIEMAHHETNDWVVLTDDCQHTTYQVNNLAANTEYVFRVSAANKHGFSEPGEISDSIVTNGLKVLSLAAEAAATATEDTAVVKNANGCTIPSPLMFYGPVSPLTLVAARDDFPFKPRVVTIDKDKKFADSYTLGEEIGKGKFGSVYKCTEKTTDRLFAAKFIRVKAGQRDEFRKEIEIMNELHHPKLLLLWDSFESAKEIILVMEHVSGGELMERIINDDYILTERECIHFMRQICDGIQYMHSSDILHLDLKPENILCITPNSNEIKIIDFGLARKFDPTKEFKIMFGTAEFVAPEVINYDAISYRTDMWSVGVVCYVLLSGLSPFLGNNDKETLVNVTKAQFDFDDEAFNEISEDAKDFISKLLVKDQRKRMWVEDSLRHPWMAQDVTYMRAKKLSTVKHKKFMARNKWQKTGHALVALRRMVGLQRMSSGLMDSCRSPPSSLSQCETPSLRSDSLSTISESDDSGFRSAQTHSLDIKSILGISKDVNGVADQKVCDSPLGGECELKKNESVVGCEGELIQEGRNEGSGVAEDCAAVRKSSSEGSEKSELSDVSKSLEVQRSEVGGEAEIAVETISLKVEKSEINDKSESELSDGMKPSEGETSEACIEKSEVVSSEASETQGHEETLTNSSPSFASSPTFDPVSCTLQENVADNTNDKSLTKSTDQKAGIGSKNGEPSKFTRKSVDQPSDLTKKRELFARKTNDSSLSSRNAESPLKKSIDQQTVSRFSEKPRATRTCSEQPTQSLPSSRNTASAVPQGKLSNKPGDPKTSPKPSEPPSAKRKSPASSLVPTTKGSDSLVSARKFAVQQSTQKSTKPKKAPTFVRKMKNLEVLEGASAKFDILVDGNPAPTISWFKDGKDIPLSPEKYRTESSDEGRCSLTVMSCGEDDDAEYGCKASNLLGSVVTKANLYVQPIGEELDINNGTGGRSQAK